MCVAVACFPFYLAAAMHAGARERQILRARDGRRFAGSLREPIRAAFRFTYLARSK